MPPDLESPQRRQILRIATGSALVASACRVFAVGVPAQILSLAALKAGHTRTVEIEGYRILLLRRNAYMIRQLKQDTSNLLDPHSEQSQQPSYAKNPWRSRHPAYLVVINHCTFDGCPTAFGGCPHGCGFSCPCCGSQYDAAGRVHKFQPAPRNLAIPHYRFDRRANAVIVERIEHVRTVE